MKKIIFWILASILLTTTVLAMYQDRVPVHLIAPQKFTYTSFIGGKQFYTEFTEKDVPPTPSWNPQLSDPPITMKTAIEKSQKYIKKFVTNPEVWEIESVKYTKIGKGKWVYELDFYLDRLQAKDGLSASFTVILKMDGTFFEPKVTPKS